MRDTSRPLPFLPAARAVFDLSLESMVWSRRSLLMGLLVGLPVVLAIVYRVVLAMDIPTKAVPPLDLYAIVVAVYWIRNVLPLVALFHATSLVADEVEGRDDHLPADPAGDAPVDPGREVRRLPGHDPRDRAPVGGAHLLHPGHRPRAGRGSEPRCRTSSATSRW